MSRTRRIFGLVAAAALAIAVLPFAALGDATTGFVDASSTATLTVETGGGTLAVTLAVDGGETTNVEQSLRKRDKCVVNTARFAPLLGIALDSAAAVGLVDSGLGSSDGKNCSSGNGRVSQGESLVLTMPDGWVATGATLDIEGKFGASLDVTTTLSGVERSTTGILLNTDGNSDNGADSGASDNTAVGVDGNFTIIALTPRSTDGRGEISLEGGGDDAALAPTVFNLSRFFEYTLDCGETRAETFADEAGPGDAPIAASVLRYDTEGKSGGCLPIGADLSSDGEGITLLNTDSDAGGNAQAPNLRLTLTWRVALTDASGGERSIEGDGGVLGELARTIDLLDGSAPTAVQYCLADKDDDTGPKPATQPTDPGGNERSWCLLHETVDVVNGYIVQTQVYDGEGDPRWQ